jgi:hypothetical protein
MLNHTDRIIKNIINTLEKFKTKSINYLELLDAIDSNVSALDCNKDLYNAFIDFACEIKTIHFTIDSDKEFEEMLIEVEKFEKFIDKNL